MSWTLRGEYVESCNCDLFCPCLLGPRNPVNALPMATPTAGYCDLLGIFHIVSGALGAVKLDGLTVAMAMHTSGRMSDGDWRIATYLTDTATEVQQRTLQTIFSGRAGGPMARVAQVVREWMEPRVVPIAYTAEGVYRRIEIPEILDVTVEGILGADEKSEIWIRNLKHLACRMIAAAIGQRGHYRDHGMFWNHTDKSALYGPFEWTG